MSSTRGNSHVYLLLSCLTAKGCKAAYKNTQNRESKRGNRGYRRDRIPSAREARVDCKFLSREHGHSCEDLMVNLLLPLPPPLTAVPFLPTCPYCTRLSVPNKVLVNSMHINRGHPEPGMTNTISEQNFSKSIFSIPSHA